jgi:hypothetical protein
MQKEEANNAFTKYIQKNYTQWMENAKGRPLMSNDIFKTNIFPTLDNKEKVEVDFSNITMVVSSFLNAAIGKLYGKYSEQFINENVKIIGLCDDDMELLNDIVIPNAKSFFENQSKIENIEKNILGE